MSKHGMIKAVDKHFEYEDGTLYFPFGTTVYAFAHQQPELIEETFQSLKNAPFNKVRMCVFPKFYQFNNNEPLFYPWEKKTDGNWNTDAPVEAYWANLESIIKRLDEIEIQCDLILFHSYDKWGFSSMSFEDDLKYLSYVINRFGKYDNIWWSLANEYDLLYAVKPLETWYQIEDFVAKTDTRHHLISNHNCFKFWDVKRPNITHASYQTKRFADVENFVKEGTKPVIIDECCYEGNIHMFWGSISGEEMAAHFWQCIASGAYCTHGETFLDPNDVLWWAKGGKLKGKSPERIRFLRKIQEEINAPLEPYDEPIDFFATLSEEDKAVFMDSPAGRSMPIAQSYPTPEEIHMQMYCEHEYLVHTADDSVILKYYYQQTAGKGALVLGKGKKYKVEVIDTWEMTRRTVAEKVENIAHFELPGKPYMAVLAMEMK